MPDGLKLLLHGYDDETDDSEEIYNQDTAEESGAINSNNSSNTIELPKKQEELYQEIIEKIPNKTSIIRYPIPNTTWDMQSVTDIKISTRCIYNYIDTTNDIVPYSSTSSDNAKRLSELPKVSSNYYIIDAYPPSIPIDDKKIETATYKRSNFIQRSLEKLWRNQCNQNTTNISTIYNQTTFLKNSTTSPTNSTDDTNNISYTYNHIHNNPYHNSPASTYFYQQSYQEIQSPQALQQFIRKYSIQPYRSNLFWKRYYSNLLISYIDLREQISRNRDIESSNAATKLQNRLRDTLRTSQRGGN